MTALSWKFNFANLTILGHFNPAILRHEFLLRNCKVDLGELVTTSPPELPLVSELRYTNIRWFMDLDRMIVENTDLVKIEDFSAPPLAVWYLGILSYTPIRFAGININSEILVPDMGVMWKNLSDPWHLNDLMRQFEGVSPELITKSRLVGDNLIPIETNLSYACPKDAFVRIQFTSAGSDQWVKVNCNWEVRDLEINKARLDFINKNYHEVASMMIKLTEAICRED